MDPRISFSNDFVVAQQTTKRENIYREAPVSSDFEFSVKNYSMISADEAFFQGMLLPLKSDCSNKKMTLRDELLVNDDYEDALPRLPKSSSRWKERLGLRKGASKKDKNKRDGFLQRVADEKGPTFGQEDMTASKDNMELCYEEGVHCRVEEIP
ncbi:uncharacterized protein LOC133310246 [Gastrolobium bilobum]|uniref:uncharacterized protein LOC133310246 n=1 Tax=Gastrolobium bilobum TaxID=150636 RepID=UPI002AAF3CD9|nr:uncharacterized protein LOC133310246 [Gastrolobium bilobum]